MSDTPRTFNTEAEWIHQNVAEVARLTDEVRLLRLHIADKNDLIAAMGADRERVERVAATGTARNFLALSDEDKLTWFANAIHESSLRKKAEAALRECLQHASAIEGAFVAGDPIKCSVACVNFRMWRAGR